jgi:hypothetical protein
VGKRKKEREREKGTRIFVLTCAYAALACAQQPDLLEDEAGADEGAGRNRQRQALGVVGDLHRPRGPGRRGNGGIDSPCLRCRRGGGCLVWIWPASRRKRRGERVGPGCQYPAQDRQGQLAIALSAVESWKSFFSGRVLFLFYF